MMEFVEIEVECRKCHNTFTVKKEVHNGLEAEKFTRRMRRYKQTCKACDQKHQHEEALKRAAELGLPEIMGRSTGQISYAFSLRDKFIQNNYESVLYTQNQFSMFENLRIAAVAAERNMSEDELLLASFKQIGLHREYLCLTEPDAKILIDYLK